MKHAIVANGDSFEDVSFHLASILPIKSHKSPWVALLFCGRGPPFHKAFVSPRDIVHKQRDMYMSRALT